jgi:hypothetical protein
MPFTGNRPENVATAAKYDVIQENGQWVVQMRYITAQGERWCPTTVMHPALVGMVNMIKEQYNNQPGGAFYINEYRQVLVPVSVGNYYCPGTYDDDLIFTIDTLTLSGRAIDEGGNQINIGNEWNNLLHGIPYILTAGGHDIKYEVQLRRNVTQIVKLSRWIGVDKAKQMAARINHNNIFNGLGGRFYINEYGNLFKPITDNGFVRYIYLGRLDLISDNAVDALYWFPKPNHDGPQPPFPH